MDHDKTTEIVEMLGRMSKLLLAIGQQTNISVRDHKRLLRVREGMFSIQMKVIEGMK